MRISPCSSSCTAESLSSFLLLHPFIAHSCLYTTLSTKLSDKSVRIWLEYVNIKPFDQTLVISSRDQFIAKACNTQGGSKTIQLVQFQPTSHAAISPPSSHVCTSLHSIIHTPCCVSNCRWRIKARECERIRNLLRIFVHVICMSCVSDIKSDSQRTDWSLGEVRVTHGHEDIETDEIVNESYKDVYM